MKFRTVVIIALIVVPFTTSAKTVTILYKGAGRSAVDVKGVRHSASSYAGHHTPWDDDRVKTVAPKYPSADRTQRHMGSGLFRVHLDLKTGALIKVDVVQSIGFTTLDESAVAALRQWRWKPERWKEIDIPVTFVLTQHK